MSFRHLLYLDSHKLGAYRWRQGQLFADGLFEASPEGLEQFSRYLQGKRNGLFYLLTNTADEGYQTEVIPFLRGRNRQILLQRKLTQYFFTTPLSTATSLGYEKDTRKNERVLLSALTNPEFLSPWLDTLETARAPLAGIYTLAQLAPTLLNRLGLKTDRCLLLTVQDKSLRENFISNGQTIFSRVTPLADSSYAGIAAAFANEAPKLQQYLISQRLIARSEKLDVFLIAHPLALPAIHNANPDQGELSFHPLDNQQAAARLGLTSPPAGCNSEALYLHLLAVAPPRIQFAAERQRHHYRIALLRRGLWISASLALLAALFFAGERLLHSHGLQNETALLALQTQELQQRYRRIVETFPPLPIDKEHLRRVIARHDELSASSRWPAPLFQHLARALDASPGIELDSLEWKALAPAKAGANSEETLIIVGNVRAGKLAGTRQTLATFDTFVTTLGEKAPFAVIVLQQPFDIEPGKSLRSGERDSESLQQHPFSVQLSRQAAP